MRQVDHNTPVDVEVHGIAGKYFTCRHPAVKRWQKTSRCFYVHFTPTSPV